MPYGHSFPGIDSVEPGDEQRRNNPQRERKGAHRHEREPMPKGIERERWNGAKQWPQEGSADKAQPVDLDHVLGEIHTDRQVRCDTNACADQGPDRDADSSKLAREPYAYREIYD